MSGGADIDSMRAQVNSLLRTNLGCILGHLGDPEAAENMLTPHEAELRAYVTVGALSQKEADAWRERFARAAQAAAVPDREVANDQSRARANQLLDEEFKALAPTLEERERERAWHGALWVLSYVKFGAFSEKEADELRERFVRKARALAVPDAEVEVWLARAREAERPETLTPPSSPTSFRGGSSFDSALHALSTVGLISDEEHDRWRARASPVPASAPQPPPPDPSFRADVLQRVVAGSPTRLRATRVVCAELFEDCVVLRWHRLLSSEEATARAKISLFPSGPEGLHELGRRWGAIFELRDDRGTRYERVRGDSGRTHHFSHRPHAASVAGASTFIPQVPPAATRLEARNGSDRFDLVLADE